MIEVETIAMQKWVERLGTRSVRTALVALAAVLVIGGVWTLWAQDEGEIVARVNGEAITKAELYDMMYQYVGPRVLDELILIRLVEQEAAAQGVTVPGEEIDAEVEAIAQQVGGTQQLELILSQQGAGLEQLRDEIRRTLLIRALLEPQIEVTDEEVRAFFEENADLFAQREMVRARHILVSTKEQAEELRRQLLDGADFATLAREHSSDAGSAARGGDLGWFGRGVMVAPFEEAAFSLKVGEISEPVQSSFGYHLIKVEERAEAKPAEFNDQVAATIRELLTEEKMQQQLGTWLQSLRLQADVEILPAR